MDDNIEIRKVLYTMSHDLKAPLISIQGLVKFAIEDAGHNQVIVEHLQDIMLNAKKLSNIVNTILELAKYGTIEMVDTEINIDENVIDIIKELSPMIEVDYQINYDNCNLLVIMNIGLFRSIMRNMLSNAIKYGTKPGIKLIININIKSVNNDLLISIEDNGPGISDEHRDKIFNMFYRVDQNKDGTGIGLAIVKNIIKSYNGTIKLVETKLGGARFEISIPGVCCVEKR